MSTRTQVDVGEFSAKLTAKGVRNVYDALQAEGFDKISAWEMTLVLFKGGLSD